MKHKIFSLAVLLLTSLQMIAGGNDLLWDYTNAAPSNNPDNGLYYGSKVTDGPGNNNGLYGIKLDGSGYCFFTKAAVTGTLTLTFGPRTGSDVTSLAIYSFESNDESYAPSIDELSLIAFTAEQTTLGTVQVQLNALQNHIYITRLKSSQTVLQKIQFIEGPINENQILVDGTCGAGGTNGDNLTWEITSGGVLKISGTGTMAEFSSNSSPWYSYRTTIKKIELQDGITNIGAYAFDNCTFLTSVILPNSIISIGKKAFSRCEKLTAINIPENISSLGKEIFDDCSKLDSVVWNVKDSLDFTYESTYESSPFYGTHIKSIEFGDKVIHIPAYMCVGIKELASVTIGNSVTSIGDNAFSGCTGLTSVTIPNSVTSIGYYAFYGCTSLPVIDNIRYADTYLIEAVDKTQPSYIIKDGTKWIGSSAFYNCRSLTSVTIPNSVTSIGIQAFWECFSLASVTIPNSVISIGDLAFEDCGLDSVLWNMRTCADFDKYSLPFKGNPITSFIIGDEVEYIPANLCNSLPLTTITLPANLTSIGTDAFKDCKKLEIIYNYSELDVKLQSNTHGYVAYYASIIHNVNQGKTISKNRPMEKNALYDMDGDGEMEFVKVNSQYNSQTDLSGYSLSRYSKIGVLEGTEYIADDYSYELTVAIQQYTHLTNDGILDYIYYQDKREDKYASGHIYSLGYIESSANGYVNNSLYSWTSSSNTYKALSLDADLNGRKDIYTYDKNGNHYIYYRQPDGSYLKTQLQILTDTAAIDSAIYEQWNGNGSGSSTYGNAFYWTSILSLRDGMFVRAPSRDHVGEAEEGTQPLMLRRVTSASTSTDKFKAIDMAVDIDRNGLVDLMSSTTGAILYNLGNNRFVMGEFPGKAIAKDLNGDGILDYVIYNESTKTVYLQIYEGYGNFHTQTLMQNFNITNVWCYDFDNDGDVDILLPFDYTTSAGYAYLVFYRNDGNNTFKKIENAFDDPVMHFAFVDCKDVDNDGKYEIIAADSIIGSSNIYNYFYKGDYYLIRYNNRFKTTADSAPFVAHSLSGYIDKPDMLVGDFDNDGILDNWHLGNGGYTLSHFSPATPNTAPAKMNKPKIVLDGEREMLRISWDHGSDAECSALDLEYSIRIGSAPGMSDIWFAAANADGKQRSLQGGNVGAYLDQWVNVSGWDKGDYYISVQAIDPSGLGGAWSDEAVYHHSLLSGHFVTNRVVLSTADTMIVRCEGVVDSTYTYTWNFGDSAVVLSQDLEQQIYQVAWNTAGEKTISLQVTDSTGRKSPLSVQKMTVYPIRFDAIEEAPTMSYFDMDMDGIMDGISKSYYINGNYVQGFMRGKGDGTFLKLAKTYNSDLTVSGSLVGNIYKDINMDGLPDVIVTTNKGAGFYNREDFDAEAIPAYTFKDDPSYAAPRVDFNNDGIEDTWYKKNDHTIALVINGEQRDTVELRLPTNYNVYDAMVSEDFDNNGYRDIVVKLGYNTTQNLIVYLYDDYKFVCQEAPVELRGREVYYYAYNTYYGDWRRTYKTVRYTSAYPFADMNSDGVPDMNGYQVRSRITNYAPSVPTNLRVIQIEDSVLLQWDAAVDRETPAAQMRYNISVKKRGMSVGDNGAFVISPMNGMYNEAAPIPGYPYAYGTTFAVPVDQFIVGNEYEFSIQSIDLWNGHSDMAAPVLFKVTQQVSLTMPTEACFNTGVNISYRGTETSGFSWDFDGGAVINGSGSGPYEVSWATGGVKNVSVTVNGMTATRSIYINGEKDFSLAFALPSEVIADTDIPFTLPDQFMNPNIKLSVRRSSNVKSIRQKEGTTTALVRFSYSGPTNNSQPEDAWVEFYYEDKDCGEMNNYRAYTQVMGGSSKPAISIVTVDGATGKNCVIWDAPEDLPAYVDKIIVYKEEGSTNNWVPQAEMAIGATQWIDMASEPAVRKNRYCIAYGTTYGYTSDKSAVHSSTHLQMNVGLHGANNLVWTKYEGGTINNYRILRGTSPDNLTLLATVPGTENTYTDLNAPDNAYYALEYDNMYFDKWIWITYAPARHAMSTSAAVRNGHSNIMTTSQSNVVTFAQSINVCAMESQVALTPSQTALHLYAEVLPAMATYKRASWKIMSGTNLATIDDNGLLIANTNGLNGTLLVRATAIDGSGIYGERYITVSGMTLNIPMESITLQSISGGTTFTNSITQINVGAIINPSNATTQSLTWTIISGEDKITIEPNGLQCMVTLKENAENGEVLIAATAQDGSGVYDTITLSVEKEAIPVYYTIRFFDWNGSMLHNVLVQENTLPTYIGTPLRPDDEQYTYTFNGWSPEIVVATQDQDYYAQYTAVLRTFTVTFVDWNGDFISSQEVKYGEAATAPAEPVRDGYTFTGWDVDFSNVTGNIYVTAQYIRNDVYYTIRFLNYDGAVLQSSQVKEGDMPAYIGTTPVRPEDAQYTYSFNGWTPQIVAVTEDADYTAQFESTRKSQGVDEVLSDQVPCTKVLIDGEIFILRGDKIYTLTGQEVR